MIAGTRIAPDGSTRHVVASIRVRRAVSIADFPSYIDNAGGGPHAAAVLDDLQRRVSRPLRLAGRAMPFDIDQLAPQPSFEMLLLVPHPQPPKPHLSNPHLIIHGVHPFDH